MIPAYAPLEGLVGPDWESAEHDQFVGDMGKYPVLAYSIKEVRRAGERLAAGVPWTSETRDEALRTFAIINSWRDSHAYPMRSIRFSVISRMRHGDIGGFTAARPKRLSSIRRKLQKLAGDLDQMNDIGGCRAICDSIQGARSLIAACRERIPHDLLPKEYDYINSPKPDGYRSHHLVYRYRGPDGHPSRGRRIELQIRTRLQHSWATAVEAVGLYRGEDMKAGEGDPDWLRLFRLMSDEFTVHEGCATAGDRQARIRELRALNEKLGAVTVMEDIKNATHFVDTYIMGGHDKPRYYVIIYGKDRIVRVSTYLNVIAGLETVEEIERRIELQNDASKVVLVEVDKVDQLVAAYPNYFGDVSMFVHNLKSLCGWKEAVEYTMAPQSVVKPKPYEKPNFGWLNRRYFRW